MATINGTPSSDTLQGTFENDQITVGAGNDRVSGLGADDLIDSDAGNDTLYGDIGAGTAPGQNASLLNLSFGNRIANTGNSADAGDSVVYCGVATLADGTSVWGRLVVVVTSDAGMPIDLDRDSPGDQESASIVASSYTALRPAGTSLNVTTGSGTVNAAPTGSSREHPRQAAWNFWTPRTTSSGARIIPKSKR
ncbi:hypothetical protein [Sulfitobacter sp. MF3-043]|uniref:hypothetical protein n=1 Tax=Sulfitobacter sediminivivens TaxID=3252902 RepID=UPI0036D8EF12